MEALCWTAVPSHYPNGAPAIPPVAPSSPLPRRDVHRCNFGGFGISRPPPDQRRGVRAVIDRDLPDCTSETGPAVFLLAAASPARPCRGDLPSVALPVRRPYEYQVG